VPEKLTIPMNKRSCRPFTDVEVKHVCLQRDRRNHLVRMVSMQGFYQRHWPLIGKDICERCNA
jgi:hypothetical protein